MASIFNHKYIRLIFGLLKDQLDAMEDDEDDCFYDGYEMYTRSEVEQCLNAVRELEETHCLITKISSEQF